MKITISCCFCSNNHEREIELPQGWCVRYDNISSEIGFCPEHSIISKFCDSQCPGCVGSWVIVLYGIILLILNII